MLAGEPGVGKTRLAQEATLAARARGFLVVAGTCYEPEHGTPFYPFLEAVSQAYDAVPSSLQAAVREKWPALGKLLPAHAIPAPEETLNAREEQQRLFWALTGFLQAASENAPVALLLDDLQWADGSTLSLLHHLARHTRAQRVLLLGTYRDVEVDRRHALDAVLLDLGRQGLLQRIELRPLSQEGTGSLVAQALGSTDISSEFVALLHSHTEGNPFFVQEVLHALVERGDVYLENGHWSRRALHEIEVPQSVRGVVGQRLAHLTDEAQVLLEEASVLGQTFTFDDLQQVDGRSEEIVERALEAAVQSGLVREAGGDVYAFNHNLTQQSLYDDLPSRRKRRLHLAAGEHLERQPEDVRERRLAEMALHFQKAGALERALPYIASIGDRAAAAFAHDDAARYYRTALDLAQGTGDRAREAEAYEKLGGLLTATIRYAEAIEMLEPAARLFAAVGDRVSEGRVVAQIGRVYFSLAAAEDGITRLEAAMETLQDEESPHVLAGLTSVLGKLYFVRGRYREALTCAERGAELARRAEQGGVLAESEITRGSALIQLGHWDAGRRVLEGAIAIAEDAGDLYSVCRALQGAAAVYLMRGELRGHADGMERALDLAKRMNNPRQTAAAMYGLFLNAFVRGDWTVAHERADRVLAVMQSLGPTWKSAFHLVGLAALAVAEGEDELATRYLTECLLVSESTGDVQTFMGAQEILAVQELERHNPQAAKRRLAPLLVDAAQSVDDGTPSALAAEDLPGYAMGTGIYHATGLLPLLVRAHLDSGDTAVAAPLVARAIEGAKAAGLRLSLAELKAIDAVRLVQTGHLSEAEAVFDEALSLYHDITYPYSEAHVLFDVGHMWEARGDVQRAQAAFQAALDIFRRLGARPRVVRTEEALSRTLMSTLTWEQG
jgi:tetratricopeptide (TPR) repeat protein